MKKQTSFLALSLLLFALPLAAQEKPRLSPKTQATGSIAGKKITIDYGAPSVRGRKIMGELVPYGKVWRTGANEATTLTTESDLVIGTVNVPAGKYTLFTLPTAEGWTLIINRQTGQWGTNYDESQDLGRVPMKVVALKAPVETMNISIAGGADKKGTLKLAWENTEVSVPVQVK